MKRFFEKISFTQFAKDICDDKELYEEYALPIRKSSNAAGYDFLAIEDMVIHPGEIKKIPTGYKAFFNEDEALLLIVRSSMGFKYNIRMCNQVGLVDSDYYNNPSNEGHMFIALQNEGKEDYLIKKGESYSQGVFINFLTCGDLVNEKRTGGIGSTDRKKDKNE